MRLALTRTRLGLKVTVSGAVVVVFLVGFLVLLGFLGGSLDEHVAEEAIHQHLAWMVSQAHMAELSRDGQRVPDEPTAARWAEELQAAHAIKLEDMKIKRAWFSGWLSVKKEFVVRVTVAADGGGTLRYFRIEQFGIGNGARVKWEGSQLGWFVPL